MICHHWLTAVVNPKWWIKSNQSNQWWTIATTVLSLRSLDTKSVMLSREICIKILQDLAYCWDLQRAVGTKPDPTIANSGIVGFIRVLWWFDGFNGLMKVLTRDCAGLKIEKSCVSMWHVSLNMMHMISSIFKFLVKRLEFCKRLFFLWNHFFKIPFLPCRN